MWWCLPQGGAIIPHIAIKDGGPELTAASSDPAAEQTHEYLNGLQA